MSQNRYQKERQKDVHVIVGIPSMRGLWMKDFGISLVGMMQSIQQHPIPWIKTLQVSLNCVTSSMLCHSRDTIVRNAVERDADYILWLDDDMIFPKDTMAHLLRWRQPFVAAQGVTKQFPSDPCAQLASGQKLYQTEDMRGLRAVKQVGLAVALTEVKYLANLKKPCFAMEYVEEKNATMGEDVYFCRKWQELNKKPIYVDTGLSWQIGHIGQYTYSMEDINVLEESA